MFNFLQCGQVAELEMALDCETMPHMHHADASANFQMIAESLSIKGTLFRSSALVHIVSVVARDRSFDHRV